ncbi:MAG: helix-turn-helix domain-containing protein [Oscillospiraceae bacterium]|jgi:transcriptional regulator with XRE-family HTH domain|nr:helix-turn-helix domain-containing protein [Oscillospiraceae bacterium]
MFKIKAPDGSNNLCGKNIKYLRENAVPPMSQRQFAKELQIKGYDVDHHFVRRVELGERFVTEIELQMLATFFNVSADSLLKPIA